MSEGREKYAKNYFKFIKKTGSADINTFLSRGNIQIFFRSLKIFFFEFWDILLRKCRSRGQKLAGKPLIILFRLWTKPV